MARDWPISKIGEFAEVKGGKRLPKGNRLSEDKTPHPYIRVIDFSDGRVSFSTLLYVPEKVFPSIKRYTVDSGDVVVSIVGTIGLVSTIPSELNNANLTENAAKILIGNTNIDSDYLSWYLKSPIGQHEIQKNTVGSTQPKLPLYGIKNIDVICPPYAEQRAIAHILGSLDDKIELNRRMNETLEAMARAIFKSWFVDFGPVRAKAEGRDPGLPEEIATLFPDSFEDSDLGEIPTGWEVGVIGDIASTALGGQWGKEKPEEGLMPAICLRGCDMEDLRKEGYAPKAPIRYIKEIAVENRLPRDNDLLIAASGAGPCGRPLWCSPLIKKAYRQPVIYSNFVKRFATPGPEYAVYLDRFFHEKFVDKSIQDFITGTSVPNLDSNGLLAGCRIVIPPKQILEVFYGQNQPIFQKLYSEENVVLNKLRDTLLAKLISGEQRVPDAEKFVEEAGL